MWLGDLSHSDLDIVIDGLIILPTVVSIYLQIVALVPDRSTSGISYLALLANAFLGSSQLFQCLSMVTMAWPTMLQSAARLIRDWVLTGWAAVGALFGLIHVALLWTGSIATYLVSASLSLGDGSSISDMLHLGTMALVLAYATAVIVPLVAVELHPTIRQTRGYQFVLALILVANRIVGPLSALIQIWFQYRELRRNDGAAGVMSFEALVWRIVALCAAAGRWLQRIGPLLLPTLTLGEPWEFYLNWIEQWNEWAFLSINYLIEALGFFWLALHYLQPTAGDMSP